MPDNKRYQILLPPDIQESWLNVIRSIQASCARSNGFGKVTIEIVVNGSEPVLWGKAEFTQIQPSQLAQFEMSPKILAALGQMMDIPESSKNGSTP